tara:strand:+ start:1937 stop:2614 length:678 start_codon:yes stop_codon:yes gene_type:complete
MSKPHVQSIQDSKNIPVNNEVKKTTNQGYIYCLSNPLFNGILKIATTHSTPDNKAKELTNNDAIPLSFNILFAKKVNNPYEKEKFLHKLLDQYTERVNPKRKFWKITPEEVLEFFNLMDGDIWKNTQEDEHEDEKEETNNKIRVLSEYFKDNQKIQHIIGINKEWIATYNLQENVINHDGVNYNTLSKFVEAHYKKEQPNSSCKAQAWIECKYKVDEQWVSIKKN